MSTRASIIYDEETGLHIYEEMLDHNVHLEIEKEGIEVNVVLMSLEAWGALGLPLYYVDKKKAAGK
jgi:hypothetical protein